MARVNRFIFNSDFMTIAHNNRTEQTVTIPPGDTGSVGYVGEIDIPIKVPKGCWARCRYRYTTNLGQEELAFMNDFLITDTKNGKQIYCMNWLVFEEDKAILRYWVWNNTDTTSVYTNAQTVTLIIDFLDQPNT